jgi:putative glutamine amidotransferase
MKTLNTVALHEGTATGSVYSILRALKPDIRIELITTMEEAYSTPFDGLMLLGGADIHPFFYGEAKRHSQVSESSWKRDRVEWMLARRALNEDKPVFGICRGHQMLTVAAGGSLYQDIHQDGLTDHHPSVHRLQDVRMSLRKHLPTYTVNSYHHQSTRMVPAGFDVAARSDDGVIEAIHRPGALGVQWHPEMLWNSEPKWAALFKWFLAGLK